MRRSVTAVAAGSPEGRAAEIEIRPVGFGHPDAVRLIAEVQAEYVVRYGGPDETPLDPLMFTPPTGMFVVGYLGGEPVATGAWRRTPVRALGVAADDVVVEVKRMYVAAGARRRGLARRVLDHLEATAREAGARAIVLETGLRQPEALALYAAAGYVEVPAFGHYADAPLSRHLGKRLGG